jgi:predicted DNA-binding transcriptional regulator AlpA
MTPDKVNVAASLMRDEINRIKDICKTLGVSRAIRYRYARVSL